MIKKNIKNKKTNENTGFCTLNGKECMHCCKYFNRESKIKPWDINFIYRKQKK
jgi:hypothetical protein